MLYCPHGGAVLVRAWRCLPIVHRAAARARRDFRVRLRARKDTADFLSGLLVLTLILTNDDGIESPGLRALFDACQSMGRCIVVAPENAHSGVGHACTTHDPISVTRHADNWYAVGGTPVDCARLASTEIAPDLDWLISGINHGGNLGADSYISGTVAAAREAALLGHRAVAVSQYLLPDREIDWETSARWVQLVLEQLFELPAQEPSFWNINLPHLPEDAPAPELVFCGLDPGPLNVRFRVSGSLDQSALQAVYAGDYHSRSRRPGRDVDVCFGGQISVTNMPLDITGDSSTP